MSTLMQAGRVVKVIAPYSGEVIGEVPHASSAEVETAIATAVRGAVHGLREVASQFGSGHLHGFSNLHGDVTEMAINAIMYILA
jgi:acyl-CoA reductase-like NAD-dependent aldehyde dehydrogenase